MYRRHCLPRGLVVLVSPLLRSRQKLVWRSRQPACHPIRRAARRGCGRAASARNDVLAYVRDVHWSPREPNPPDSWLSRGGFQRSRGPSPVTPLMSAMAQASLFPAPGIHTQRTGSIQVDSASSRRGALFASMCILFPSTTPHNAPDIATAQSQHRIRQQPYRK